MITVSICYTSIREAILTKILMNINSQILRRINHLLQEVARRRVIGRTRSLRPRMPASESVSWRKDKLTGACGTDTVNGGLIILENELGRL